MTEIETKAVTPVVDLRGLVLVAHHAFRKETPSLAGQAKGSGTAAAERYRQSKDKKDFHDIIYNVKLQGCIVALMDMVGAPSEVPYQALTQFLLAKQNLLHSAYDGAHKDLYSVTNRASHMAPELTAALLDAGADPMQEVVIHQGLVDAHLHVLQSFSKHFGPVIRQLNGA
jgi:hypothetical protein